MNEEKEILLYFSRGTDTFKDNLKKTIAEPVDGKMILDYLEGKDLKGSSTYDYVENNLKNIFVWGEKEWKIETDKKESFSDFKNYVEEDSKNVYMIFIANKKIQYIGKVEEVNDIKDNNVNENFGDIFWNDSDYDHIWFLDDIKSVNQEDEVDSLFKSADRDLNLHFKYYKEGPEDDKGLFVKGNWSSNVSKIDKGFHDIGKKKLKKLMNILQSEDYKPVKGYEIIDTKRDDHNIINLLKKKKQVVFYGPPGTGKTYRTKEISVELLKDYFTEGKY